jgi:hypothetical protein
MARAGKKPGPKPMAPQDRRVQIPVRVRPEMRDKLKQLAKHNKHTVSRVVEFLLDRKLIDVEWRGDHHYWFGLLMARAAWEVERRMDLNPPFFASSKGWLENAFAAQYLRAVIIDLLDELVPSGPAEIPDELKRTGRQLPPSLSPEQVAYFNSPEGLGRELAQELINRLHYDTEQDESDGYLEQDHHEMPHVQDADLMAKIRKGLGLTKGGRK